MAGESRRCPLCGGNRVSGETTFTADIGTGVVLVRSVPATICDQCGEDWINNDTAKRLETIIGNASDHHALIEVMNY